MRRLSAQINLRKALDTAPESDRKVRHAEKDRLTAARALRILATVETSLASCVGRNIAQAADGNSHSVRACIKNFMVKTSGMAPEKRKAILDGMLFEIFSDPDRSLRDDPKRRVRRWRCCRPIRSVHWRAFRRHKRPAERAGHAVLRRGRKVRGRKVPRRCARI